MVQYPQGVGDVSPVGSLGFFQGSQGTISQVDESSCGRRKVTRVAVLCRQVAYEASREQPRGANLELSPGLRGERRTEWS
jgi:hypothetical protein